MRTGINRFAGSYGYSFGCLFLVVFLIYDFRVGKHKATQKIVEFALIILFSYVVLKSGFTTALVLYVLGVFAALFYPKKHVFLASIIMIIAAIILIQTIPVALSWIVGNIDLPSVYRAKIIYLSQLSDSSADVTYADSTRGGMFYDSLAALVKYPVLGSYILAGKSTSKGHAILLDNLVNHGLIYFILYIYAIITNPWKLMKGDKTIQLVYITMIVLLGLTDTIDYATMAIPLFIGPMIAGFSKTERIE